MVFSAHQEALAIGQGRHGPCERVGSDKKMASTPRVQLTTSLVPETHETRHTRRLNLEGSIACFMLTQNIHAMQPLKEKIW